MENTATFSRVSFASLYHKLVVIIFVIVRIVRPRRPSISIKRGSPNRISKSQSIDVFRIDKALSEAGRGYFGGFCQVQKTFTCIEVLKVSNVDGGTFLYRRVNGVFVATKQWYYCCDLKWCFMCDITFLVFQYLQ